jgi:hypothetical protein
MVSLSFLIFHLSHDDTVRPLWSGVLEGDDEVSHFYL